MASSARQTEINAADLSLAQLAEVKKQLDEELSHLTQSFAQLKRAQAQFRSCVANVESVKPANKDKQILVPLTTSLYVPGKLMDVENVIVDVGTGYYVKKTTDQAKKHYSDKVSFVGKNLEQLQTAIERKQDNVNTVLQIMQAKISAGEKMEG